jgi:hypothetical protein
MRAHRGSLRMRRPLSRLSRHGWLLGFLLGAAAAVFACWLLDLLGVRSDVEPDAHREGRLLPCSVSPGALDHIETAAQMKDRMPDAHRPARVNNAIHEWHARPACRAIAKNS